MKNKQQVLGWSQYILAVIGAVALGYWGAVFLNTRLYQARATRAFEGNLRMTKPDSQPALGSQPATMARLAGPLEGSVVGRLAIPRLGLESIVVEGWKRKTCAERRVISRARLCLARLVTWRLPVTAIHSSVP